MVSSGSKQGAEPLLTAPSAVGLWFEPWTDAWTRTLTYSAVLSANHWSAADERRAQARAAALVTHARAHSPFYARHYAQVKSMQAWTDLPITTRNELMAHFDNWATDRAIHRASVDAFLNTRDNLADDYLGRYAVWTSSGTCGQWGIFVQPHDALAVYDAELSTRAQCQSGTPMRLGQWPAVLIAALEGHYGGIVTWRRLQRAAPWLAAQMHALSVKTPLEELVTQLNHIQPRFLAAYPSVLNALADEQAQGRLRIAPALSWSGGEALAPAARAHIADVFACELINDYAASECMSMAFECPQGRMHLNADWVVLEAVDERYRPVPVGQPSHTTLLTNLANRVQPLIRYDLGDSITLSPDPCPCGCARPSFTVSGRTADVLHLPRRQGRRAVIFPLALQSVLEEGAGVTSFQVVQISADQLHLRLGACHSPEAAQQACALLRAFLAQHGVDRVRVELDPAAPCPECGSGKVRQVVALRG